HTIRSRPDGSSPSARNNTTSAGRGPSVAANVAGALTKRIRVAGLMPSFRINGVLLSADIATTSGFGGCWTLINLSEKTAKTRRLSQAKFLGRVASEHHIITIIGL